MFLVDHPISQPSLGISPIWTFIIAAEVINYHSVWKLCFYVGTTQRICLFSDDFYSDNTLILTTIAVKYYIDIGARTHECSVFLCSECFS
jgi:hypothetical protein